MCPHVSQPLMIVVIYSIEFEHSQGSPAMITSYASSTYPLVYLRRHR